MVTFFPLQINPHYPELCQSSRKTDQTSKGKKSEVLAHTDTETWVRGVLRRKDGWARAWKYKTTGRIWACKYSMPHASGHRPVLPARTGILDGLELRALNARLSSLGFTSRQQGVEEVAGCTL